MGKFFTADTHFRHRKIHEYFPMTRPYKSIEEHDEGLIAVWNATVRKGDEIYHLGDFSFGPPTETEEILKRLNGRIHLVRGNHDSRLHKLKQYFESFQEQKFVSWEHNGENLQIAMCHFPWLIWDKAHYGAIHVHGHCHGSLPLDPKAPRVDVGWDVWGKPVSLDELLAYIARHDLAYVPRDHHGGKKC